MLNKCGFAAITTIEQGTARSTFALATASDYSFFALVAEEGAIET